MLRFWGRKDKRKRREILMPDISRVTPYPTDICIARLQKYCDSQKRHTNTKFTAERDPYNSETWHFTLRKTFRQQESGRGGSRVEVKGDLTKWGPDNFTKVRAIANASSTEYLQLVAIVVFVIIMFGITIMRDMQLNIYLLLCLFLVGFAAYFLSNILSSIRKSKIELTNEIKEILHRENGSIE